MMNIHVYSGTIFLRFFTDHNLTRHTSVDSLPTSNLVCIKVAIGNT